MRVRMLRRCAGPAGNWGPGEVVDLDDGRAAELIRLKCAEAIEAPRSIPVETADQEPDGETAAMQVKRPPGRPRKTSE